MINPDDLLATTPSVEFLEDILRINSVSGNEAALSLFLKNFLIDHGFTIKESNIGNVVGVKGHGSPTLLLASHLDTVFTDNPVRDDGEYLYGTGAVDCKGSLASMFYAGATAPWDEDQGTLILAGLVHEETDDAGITEFLQMGLDPDFAIFGEPSKNDRICVGYRGRVWTRLTVNTEPGHTACKWDFENGIELFYGFYQKLVQFVEELNVAHEKPEDPSPEISRFNELTVTLSTLHAGEESNVLPKSCTGDLDFRLPPWINAEEFTQLLSHRLRIIANGKRESWKKPVHLTFEIVNKTDPVVVGGDNPLVQALRWSAFKEMGRKIGLLYKTGTTYTNILQEHYSKHNPDFVCITYGPGDPRLEHTDHERISKGEFNETIRIYQRFFPKFLDVIHKAHEMQHVENPEGIYNFDIFLQ
jgi:LysW-gamma-L-lysine carboxypeptidase